MRHDFPRQPGLEAATDPLARVCVVQEEVAMSGMADQSRISKLASIIGSGTLQLDNYYKSHSLPSPTLSVEADPGLPIPESLSRCRDEILDASSELQALLAGPLAHLTRLTSPTVS